MRTKAMLSVFAVMLCAVSMVAQSKPGTVAALEFQKPKEWHGKQYEDGRKQKAAWHKQQNDTQPLYGGKPSAARMTRTFIVGRLDQHWADFDKPAIPDQADLDEFQKVLGNYVDSIVARYYESLPKVSNMPPPTMAPKFDDIITFHVRYGKESDFRSAISRIHDASQENKMAGQF